MKWFGNPKKIDFEYMQKKEEELLQKDNKRAKFADEVLINKATSVLINLWARVGAV